MPRYVINKNQQSNGDHEIHDATNGCIYMPLQQNQVDLGVHGNCQSAVAAAKKQWPSNKINGCRTCCYPCHTS